ncbi:D-lactate dehydrogenase (acceptor) [uncultured archaeon]|nr:D-lactate dehydrogenase (acceptor) [uncultured archaeon]
MENIERENRLAEKDNMKPLTVFLKTLSKELGTKIQYDTFTGFCYESDIGKSVKGDPIAVLFPESSEDVSTILKIANDYHVPITVRGGGTTVGGESVANDSVLIDTKKLNKCLDIDIHGKFAYFEAGITWIELYDILKRYDLTFDVAPSSATCTVGGAISVGGFDNHSFIKGSSADQIKELEVVLPDGKIVVCNSEKNNIIFSNILYGHGQIGIITKIKIKISSHPGKSYESWFAYPDRKSAMEDYFKFCENGFGDGVDGIIYNELLNVPIVRLEKFEEPVDAGKVKGKLLTTFIDENYYINHAKNVYASRVRIRSFPFLLRYSPVSTVFIDIVYPDKKYMYDMFEYSDKIWKNVKKQGLKTLSKQILILAHRVTEDSKTRPFSPFPSEIKKGDLIFGTYFGAELLSKDYLKYHQTFNHEMIKKTIEVGGMLYKYGGYVRQFAEKMFPEERWAYLLDMKEKYDPNNILNRGVLFE